MSLHAFYTFSRFFRKLHYTKSLTFTNRALAAAFISPAPTLSLVPLSVHTIIMSLVWNGDLIYKIQHTFPSLAQFSYIYTVGTAQMASYTAVSCDQIGKYNDHHIASSNTNYCKVVQIFFSACKV